MLKKINTAIIQKLTYNCEQATAKISLSHEQPLNKAERLQLYAHRKMCKECEQFYQNDKKLSRMIAKHKYQNITNIHKRP